MYHNLAETKLFYQAPGYLSAHLESFWRSSALPQIFNLEIFESFVSKKKKKPNTKLDLSLVSSHGWEQTGHAPFYTSGSDSDIWKSSWYFLLAQKLSVRPK